MIAAVSQATTLAADFAADVAGLADAGGRAAEVWLTKLETHLQNQTLADTKALLESRGVACVAAAVQGGLLLSQGEERQVHFEHFRRRLELCEFFGIPVMVVTADFVARPAPTDLQRALVSLTQAGQWADGFGVRLALEFRGGDAFCNNLDSALSLVEATGQKNVGVCLDLFHYYKGPSKPEDLERLDHRNLFHVQVCDVPGVPREVMGDSDRVFPGEGDFRLDGVFDRLRELNYGGAVSVELMNPAVGSAKPSQVAELALSALKRYLPG